MPLLIAFICLFLPIAQAANLDQIFARAVSDDDAVVELIRSVSAEIPHLATADAADLADRVAPYCRRLYLSPEHIAGMELLGVVFHRAATGETLTTIARRYRISIDLLRTLNARAAATPGRLLKVVDLRRQDIELVVSRSAYRLMVWRGAMLVGVFPVGLGAARTPTPLGQTIIANRVRNPAWRDPDTRKILAPSDPANVLGGYWLGFDHSKNKHFTGIGIHGYTAEKPSLWLGKSGSHGCVRLTQDDIAAVFALARPGMRVSVRD